MNYLAILVAAILGMVVGFVWYGPLFGKMWMKLSGFTQEDMQKASGHNMNKTYALAFLSVLVTAWILSLMISEFSLSTSGAMRLGFLVWLGFLVPTLASAVLWEGKKVKLFVLNAAERLVSLLAMSGLLGLWR